MKITIAPKPRGIVLAVTLATILILVIIIVAYSSLVNNRNNSVARSQSWNGAIPVAESGVEEALTQLHYAGTNSLLLLSNSWTFGLDGLYHKSRTFSDGTYFNASIQVASNPIIVSTGYVPIIASSSNLTRRVRVVTQPLPPSHGGLNASNGISFSGGNSYVDSFDSSNPLYSSNGQYVASKREQNSLVLTDLGAAGAISGGTIYGNATTGPGGTVTGSTVTGTISDDANAQFNDASAPFAYGTGATPVAGKYNGTNCNYVLNGGNYNMGSLSLTGGSELAVASASTLYVDGNMKTAGNAFVYIAPGASLTVYVNNGSIDLGGNGVINGNQLASMCTVYGLPGCTSVSIHGNGAFVGTVYAPEAAISIVGNGGVVGALTGNTISLTGNAAVHYDEALNVASTNFVVFTWNEFSPGP